MARVAQLARAAVRTRSHVNDEVERAERLRDPSHVRTTREDEWRGYFAGAGLEVEAAERFVEHLDFESWLARTGCDGDDAERCASCSPTQTDGDGWN